MLLWTGCQACLNFIVLLHISLSHFALFAINILQINVSISSRDKYCIEVVLRCLAVAGDGLGPREFNDGGVLGIIIAAGFKGSNISWCTINYIFFPFEIPSLFWKIHGLKYCHKRLLVDFNHLESPVPIYIASCSRIILQASMWD